MERELIINSIKHLTVLTQIRNIEKEACCRCPVPDLKITHTIQKLSLVPSLKIHTKLIWVSKFGACRCNEGSLRHVSRADVA